MYVQVYDLLLISGELDSLERMKKVDFFDGLKLVPISDRENQKISSSKKIFFDFFRFWM